MVFQPPHGRRDDLWRPFMFEVVVPLASHSFEGGFAVENSLPLGGLFDFAGVNPCRE